MLEKKLRRRHVKHSRSKPREVVEVTKGSRKPRTSGCEGVLTLAVAYRLSPEPGVLELLKTYRSALNYALNKILDLNLRSLKNVHKALYRDLIEKFKLPSRIAVDCYRDALANAKSWRMNPRRGKRPLVKKLSMLLHNGLSYRIRDGYVEIIGGLKLKIVGWDRRYDAFENREARLVYKDGALILWVYKRIPKPATYKPIDVIAVDINERYVVYGDGSVSKFVETAVERAYKYKVLAEILQRKYSQSKYQAWKRRRGILERIRAYHRRARNILEDWARKTALEIVRSARENGYAVAREDLNGLIESLRKLPRDHRVRLIMLGYSRLARWIDWQCEKQGVPNVIVEPKGTSSECPLCYARLVENGYRKLKCPKCKLEEDRDVVGKLNIRRRALRKLNADGGALTPPTAPQMTDVNPNRWGEPMSHLGVKP